MHDLVQTLTQDCNEYPMLDSSYASRCPACYLKFAECPFSKHCEMIIERDWVQVLKKEIDEYLKEA